MQAFKPQLLNVNDMRNFPLTITHPYHVVPDFQNLLDQGKKLNELGEKIGADAVTRSGTLSQSMLSALDKVSAYQQNASSLSQQTITDPDSVDIQDLTIAQAFANTSLNMTRNVLNRIVQSWRDIINTR